jgi:hypothetical protein
LLLHTREWRWFGSGFCATDESISRERTHIFPQPGKLPRAGEDQVPRRTSVARNDKGTSSPIAPVVAGAVAGLAVVGTAAVGPVVAVAAAVWHPDHVEELLRGD